MKKFFLFFSAIALTNLFWACDMSNTEDKDTIDDEIPEMFSKIEDSPEVYSLVFGAAGNNDDELASGMVADAQGNMYASLNTTTDVIVLKVNADGSKAWAKIWDGMYKDFSPDSGENNETGGTANSVSMDSEGNIYVAVSASDVSQNNFYSAVLLKINPADGSLIWQKRWKHEGIEETTILAYMDARAYAVDATQEYVYLTGADGRNGVMVLAFNKSDGSLFFQKSLDIVSGTKDRGYCIKSDNSGNVFIGGVDGSQPYLAKISGANTVNPNLEFVKKIDIGYGGRINGIDIDTENNLYLSCDRRGVETYFSVVKLDNNATLLWGKTFPANNEDRNNTHVVKLIGDAVMVGGRIGHEDLDKQFGDGMVLKLSKSDGSMLKHGIYWSGAGDNSTAEHRIKGFAENSGKLLIYGQIYTGPDNSSHYTAQWLKADYGTEDFLPGINPINGASFTDYTQGGAVTAIGTWSDAGAQYQLLNAKDKTSGTAPDGDVFFVKMTF